MHDLEEYLSVLETVADRTVEFEKVTQEQSVMVACAFLGFVTKVFHTIRPELSPVAGIRSTWKLNDSGNFVYWSNSETLALQYREKWSTVTSTTDFGRSRDYNIALCEKALPEIATALPYLLNLNREIVQVRQEATIKAITEIKGVCAKALKEMRKLPAEEVSQ